MKKISIVFAFLFLTVAAIAQTGQLKGTNVWTGSNVFNGPINGQSFSGNFTGNGGGLTNLNAINQEYTFGYIQVNVFTNGSKPGSSGQTFVGNSENGRIPFQVPSGYPVKSPRVWVANNFYNLCCYIESTNPFPYTIQAAWEYPSNVFTPITWNGGANVTMGLDGNPIPSDQSTNVFPAAATVFLRYYLTAAQQGFYPISQRQTIAGNLPGGAVQQGTNLAMNLNAPIPSSNITFSWAPFALTATRADNSQTPPVAIVMVGDSIAQGLNGFSWAQNAFTNNIAIANYGKVGSGIGINTVPENAAYIKYCNAVICEGGINNFRNGGVSFATMTNLLVQEWMLYANAGKKVYQTTYTPYTTSTDSWATTNNQTVVATCEPVRVPLNAWIKTRPYPLSGYIDLAAACASPNPAFWIPGLTGDGLHPEGQGVTSLAAVGVNLQNLGLYQTVSGNQQNYSGSFAGDGSGLTGIQASNVVGVVQQNGTATNLTVNIGTNTSMFVFGTNASGAEIAVVNSNSASFGGMTAQADNGSFATNYIGIYANGSKYVPNAAGGVTGSTNDLILEACGQNMFIDLIGGGKHIYGITKLTQTSAITTNFDLSASAANFTVPLQQNGNQVLVSSATNGVVFQGGTYTNANFTGNITGNTATTTFTVGSSAFGFILISQGGSLGGEIGVVGGAGQFFTDARQNDYINKEASGSHRELLGSGGNASSMQIDMLGINCSVPLTNTSGYYGFSSTNTLIVTSAGLTNLTADTYLVSTTAGTGMTLKDGNGNQFLSPIINSTFLLKPNFRFAGITITATAQIFNK